MGAAHPPGTDKTYTERSHGDSLPSEPSRREELAVVPLLGRGPREPFGTARQDVLLDHQPAAERDPAQAVQYGIGVQVAVAQRAERLPGPDLGHRRLVGDDLSHDRQPRVL